MPLEGEWMRDGGDRDPQASMCQLQERGEQDNKGLKERPVALRKVFEGDCVSKAGSLKVVARRP